MAKSHQITGSLTPSLLLKGILRHNIKLNHVNCTLWSIIPLHKFRLLFLEKTLRKIDYVFRVVNSTSFAHFLKNSHKFWYHKIEKINLAYDLMQVQETIGSAFCISNALITPSSPNYFTWCFNIFGWLGLLY